MPSLNVAWVLRMKSFSSRPSSVLNARMGGIVASPTPTMPISGDSITHIFVNPSLRVRARAAAAIHPAEPPPRMMTERMRRSEPVASIALLDERRGDVAPADEEGIADEPERPYVHVRAPSRDQLGETAIDGCIFDMRVAAARRHAGAVDHELVAAVRQAQRAGFGLHVDVPALRAGLAEIERGVDPDPVLGREHDVGGDRRLAIRRDMQIGFAHEEGLGKDFGEDGDRVDARIEHAEAAGLPDPGLARMPLADVFLPRHAHTAELARSEERRVGK